MHMQSMTSTPPWRTSSRIVLSHGHVCEAHWSSSRTRWPRRTTRSCTLRWRRSNSFCADWLILSNGPVCNKILWTAVETQIWQHWKIIAIEWGDIWRKELSLLFQGHWEDTEWFCICILADAEEGTCSTTSTGCPAVRPNFICTSFPSTSWLTRSTVTPCVQTHAIFGWTPSGVATSLQCLQDLRANPGREPGESRYMARQSSLVWCSDADRASYATSSTCGGWNASPSVSLSNFKLEMHCLDLRFWRSWKWHLLTVKAWLNTLPSLKISLTRLRSGGSRSSRPSCNFRPLNCSDFPRDWWAQNRTSPPIFSFWTFHSFCRVSTPIG